MNQRILVLQGVPGSGKSTWAKNFVADKDNWVIVNRDSIREGTGKYWVPSRESYITQIETFCIEEAIHSGLNVIIDATNLNPKTIDKWTSLAKKLEVEIEFKEFKISFNDAYWRDRKRNRSVGKKIISQFFSRYYPNEPQTIINPIQYDDRFILQQDETLPQAIIVDCDGTLCKMNGRTAFDYSKVNTDLPNNPIVDLINTLSKQYQIIVVTGREDTDISRQETLKWLNRYLTFDDFLFYMRPKGDYRSDDVIKSEIYKQYIKDKYYVVSVFDDRDKVVKMWRDLGLQTNQVYYGDF